MRLIATVFLISLVIFCVQKEEVKSEVVSSSFSVNCGSGKNFYEVLREKGSTIIKFGVNLPNPCYKAETVIENGVLKISVERRDTICIQCLAYGEGVVRVKVDISKVEIYVDGSKVELERK